MREDTVIGEDTVTSARTAETRDLYGSSGWGGEPLRERLEQREVVALGLVARHLTHARAPGRVVDLGCGDGLMLAELARAFPEAHLTGLDLSETQVAKARTRGLGADLRAVDLTVSPILEPGSTDLVYAGEVVEHMPSPDDFLADAYDALRPGGHLLVTTPNLLSWFNRVIVLAGVGPVYVEYSTRDSSVGMGMLRRIKAGTRPVGHIRVLSARALRDLLSQAGFSVVAFRGAPFDAAPRVVGVVDGVVARIAPSLAGILVCLARKP